jgi:energy-coupling factor transporter ATP-binding protein EcfA2
MASGIERLALRHFRGATRPAEFRFRTDRPLVLIYGENGAGKSTLVDAIDLVCNRSAGSVADRASANPRQHLASLGHSAGDLRVELDAGGLTWSGTYAGRGVAVEGPGSPPAAYVLRRRQLLRLIEASPSDRYRELQRFIDVSGVERAEAALNDATRAASARREELARQKQAAEAALAQLWDAEGRPLEAGPSALAWAGEKVAADLEATRALAHDLEWLGRCVDAAATAGEQQRASGEEARRCEGEVARLEAELRRRETEAAGEGSAVLPLLKQVQSLLAQDEAPDHCPLCRQPVEGVALRAVVASRVAALAELEAVHAELEAAREAARTAAAIAARDQAQFIEAGRTLATEARASRLEGVARMGIVWEEYPDLVEDGGPGTADDRRQTTEGSAQTAADPSAVCRLSSAVPGPHSALRPPEEVLRQAEELLARFQRVRESMAKRRARAENDVGQYNALCLHYGRLQEAEQQLAREGALHERLARALRVVRERRIAYTGELLERVASESNRRYRAIHPGEPLGLSGFRLDEKRRASLLQEAYFLGEADVPPQAYFSEAHLDTLGFCLFVALARLYSGGEAILVLDDVFASVDEGHAGRLLDLLVEECRAFRQLIITTHSRAWWDRCLAHPTLAALIDPVELRPWTPEEGIQAEVRRGPAE